MAWGEVHCMVGALIGTPCLDAPEKLIVAIPLAIASHYPLDDLNIGPVGRIYHGCGKKWRLILTSICRVPIIAAIIWILWHEPLLMATALPAWLCLDFEWGFNLFGRHGIGLHKNMWREWMYGEWGLLAWFFVMIAFVWLLWG